MTSKESAIKENRAVIDSVRKTLRGFFYFFAGILWFVAFVFFFRRDMFQSGETSPLGGLFALTGLTLFLAMTTRFFREASLAWREFPFWSDEFHFTRDHVVGISFPLWGITLAVLSQFPWNVAFLPMTILLAVDTLSIFFLPAPTERFIRLIRTYGDRSLFVDDKTTSYVPEVEKSPVTIKILKPSESTESETVPFQKTESAVPPQQPELFDADGASEETKTIKIGPFTESVKNFFGANEEDFDEEFEEESEEVPPPDDMLLSQNRFIEDDGTERIEGWFRVPFKPDEETSVVHLSFCPPLKSPPHLQLIQIAGPDVQMTPTAVETFGARIEVKRQTVPLDDDSRQMTVSAGFPDPSIRVCFFIDQRGAPVSNLR